MQVVISITQLTPEQAKRARLMSGYARLIGNLLSHYRLTLPQLADLAGCSLATVEKWARGKRLPSAALRNYLFRLLAEARRGATVARSRGDYDTYDLCGRL